VAYLCYIIHAMVIYSASVSVLGGMSPLLRNFRFI
jgi:hypothetical protein